MSNHKHYYFECTQGTSHKFWEIAYTEDGTNLGVRYGRIGDTGRITNKKFANHYTLENYVGKKLQEKRNKGYVKRETIRMFPGLVSNVKTHYLKELISAYAGTQEENCPTT